MKIQPHSDLACESSRLAGISGGRTVTRTIGGVRITDIRIPEQERRIRPGRYITLEGDPSRNALPALLRRALEQILPTGGTILAAGLGNPDITRDSLGALAIRRLVPQRGSRYSLAAIETDVAARTGIETVSLVRAAAREIDAACVIAVDSLCCTSPERLCRTVQLSTAGITPGSGSARAAPGAFLPHRRSTGRRSRSAYGAQRGIPHPRPGTPGTARRALRRGRPAEALGILHRRCHQFCDTLNYCSIKYLIFFRIFYIIV